MRRIYLISLFLWSLLLVHQAARADGVVVFNETFDNSTVKGGRDGDFNNGSGATKFDNTGWTGDNSSKIYGAYKCIRFGTGSDLGVATTPTISFEGTQLAVLTFSAAGWGDNNKNTVTVSVSNGQMSGDVNVELENAVWNDYTCVITGTGNFTITFTGKRGFLDDVVVTHITSVDAPELTESCTFWPQTTEAASKNIVVTPSLGATVRYTTDGSEPTVDHGTEAMLTAHFSVHATTTVKAIAFVGDVTSDVVTKTYTLGSTTVNSIADFNALADGTEVRLYLADDNNARVLHGQNEVMYLRDNTGALCVDFGEKAFNPTPQHNQHVAGWIVGQKQTVNGLPKLVATDNTTTDYLALAAPVTELATEPTAVAIDAVDNYKGDWVTLSGARVGSDIAVSNNFNVAQYTNAYDGALADLSGIVTANGLLAPVYYNNIVPVVYVIDEDKEFVSPDADIDNATVRLKRTLSSSYWNTFVVPFNIATMEGDIREYSSQNGNTMVFAEANSIEAGKPYIVKPVADVENPTYSNVKLSAALAQSIDNEGYSFVAIYSPTKLATNQTEFFLKSDGRLYYPESESVSRLKGMRAYFKAPAGQQANIFFGDGDMPTDISEEVIENSDKYAAAPIYDLQGRRVANLNSPLKKGLYIVNGKKIIIK